MRSISCKSAYFFWSHIHPTKLFAFIVSDYLYAYSTLVRCRCNISNKDLINTKNLCNIIAYLV